MPLSTLGVSYKRLFTYPKYNRAGDNNVFNNVGAFAGYPQFPPYFPPYNPYFPTNNPPANWANYPSAPQCGSGNCASVKPFY